MNKRLVLIPILGYPVVANCSADNADENLLSLHRLLLMVDYRLLIITNQQDVRSESLRRILEAF